LKYSTSAIALSILLLGLQGSPAQKLAPEKTASAKPISQVTTTITATKKWLLIPVKNGAEKHVLNLTLDGAYLRAATIELSESEPDWLAPLDISQWKGKHLQLSVDGFPPESKLFDRFQQTDTYPGIDTLYHEAQREQFHFSPRRGKSNDPNGMVWSEGVYHLYFQLSPYGLSAGNLSWGHATSKDLLHWQEQPIAIHPHALNDLVYSGSAVVDAHNTSGWKTGKGDLLVAAFTSTKGGECIVYSNDGGKTWTEYAGNPVVKHQGRDPRLLWHEPSKQWVMALYDEDKTQTEKNQLQTIAFYTSPDLKTWTYQSRVRGFYECPDIFELPIDGSSERKWVLTSANSDYRIGSFDGKTFLPETPKLRGQMGAGFYAAQTFTNEPKGRIVQIGWLQTNTKGMPFNQSFSVPLRLKLLETPQGLRLARTPVAEIANLRKTSHDAKIKLLHAGDTNPFSAVKGELLEVDARLQPADDSNFQIVLRGIPISYSAKAQQLTVMNRKVPLELRDGKLALRALVDRTSIEVFANDGLVYIPLPVIVDSKELGIQVGMTNGSAKIEELKAYELSSIWQ
jgi:sucrose-6-phosphate hydrolase SacC (GH32 family)